MQSDLVALGKVLASRHKLRMMTLLSENMMTPSQIKGVLDISMPLVSKLIHQLVTLGLVECVTPELRKGRLYSLTSSGKKALENLESIAAKSKGRVNDQHGS